MANLCVNIDHIATLRQARKELEPDPIAAAVLVEQAGGEGITVHLREDRRHIQDRDVFLLREIVKTKLNLEMAATPEMVEIATKIKPEECTLVPEKREELTTEGGLDVANQLAKLQPMILRLQRAGITVSLFIDPTPEQITAGAEAGANFVELHTGAYARAKKEADIRKEFQLLVVGARLAQEKGLRVNAGHGLTYQNVAPVAGIAGIEDLNIGHNIIARSALVGIDCAVRDMLDLVK
ncbi:pyridoxine 5'-phosphate synthase [bacterium]|nr:pyridoxine 5'-phosphate synthase [bacterium]